LLQLFNIVLANCRNTLLKLLHTVNKVKLKWGVNMSAAPFLELGESLSCRLD